MYKNVKAIYNKLLFEVKPTYPHIIEHVVIAYSLTNEIRNRDMEKN